MAGVEKVSFHESRICRRAFVKEQPLPAGWSDRVIQRWNREKPPVVGQATGICVMTVLFPEGHLSPDLPTTTKKIAWLPMPKRREARFFQIVFTYADRESLRKAIEPHGKSIVEYHPLPNGECVTIITGVVQDERNNLIVQANADETEELLLPYQYRKDDPKRGSGFTFVSGEPDRDLLFVELSGYRAPVGTGRRLFHKPDIYSRVVHLSGARTKKSDG